MIWEKVGDLNHFHYLMEGALRFYKQITCWICFEILEIFWYWYFYSRITCLYHTCHSSIFISVIIQYIPELQFKRPILYIFLYWWYSFMIEFVFIMSEHLLITDSFAYKIFQFFWVLHHWKLLCGLLWEVCVCSAVATRNWWLNLKRANFGFLFAVVM